MSLSATASQQRDRQTRLSHPLFVWGMAGSIAFHAGILPAVLLLAWRETPPQPAEIELVFTEPIEPVVEEPETAVLEEETIDDVPIPSTSLPEPLPVIPDPVEETPDDIVEDVVESEVVEEQPNRLDDLLASIRQRQGPRTVPRGNRPRRSAPSNPSNGRDQVARATPPPPEPAGGGSRTVACRRCPKPSYPRSALNAGAEGTVNIMVDINPDGAVTSASLVGSSGHASLDQAALSAVRSRWRFQPIRGGASGVVISVVMTIEGSDLNQRAQEQGDRESVEIPSQETAAEETSDDESTASNSSEEESDASSSTQSEPSANDLSDTNPESPPSELTTTQPTSPSEAPASSTPDVQADEPTESSSSSEPPAPPPVPEPSPDASDAQSSEE